MLDTGKARQNADPYQADNPEPTYIPQMLIRKSGDPQCVSFNVSQDVTNLHVIT